MLEIKNITISYKGVGAPVRAVADFSLTLERGECLGIVGESGSGKSSIALAIMGLVSGGEVSGEILFNGDNLLNMESSQLNRHRWKSIAMVFQNSLEVLNPVLTVGEQIAEPLKKHFYLTSSEAEEKVKLLMEQVGLSSKWYHYYPHELSGGMRQRILIAMAISCDPELLIVDEPTTALDPESAGDILKLIENYLERTGASMIMISHNMAAISRMTSRIITLYSGCVVEEGKTKEVFANPMHCYTRGLLNASPDYYIYRDLWGIPGEPPVNGTAMGCVFYPRCNQSQDMCSHVRPDLKKVAAHRSVACHKGGIEILLRGRGIHKSYGLNGKSVSVLKGVNIDIRSGEVAALVGKSGSGKSTLGQILVNLITPDRGKSSFMGQDVEKGGCTNRMEGIQMVFQDSSSSISNRMKVIDVVKEPLNIMNWKTYEEQKARVVEVLSLVHLPVSPEFLNLHSRDLSGGQRQRIAIARALITRPKLIIADEITSMLDPSTKANLLRELKGIQSRTGFAMLFITHDLFLAGKVADRMYEMNEGTLMECSCRTSYEHSPTYDHNDQHLLMPENSSTGAADFAHSPLNAILQS